MRAAASVLAILCVGLAARAADGPLVAVVAGVPARENASEEDERAARLHTETAEDALRAAGLAWAPLSSADVAAGRLTPYRVALFPHAGRLAAAEVAAIERFARDGGKILFFYFLPDRIADLLGLVSQGEYRTERRNEFATLDVREGVVQGTPRRVRQDSWVVTQARPSTPATIALGEWHDPGGLRTGVSALFVGPRGAFLGHVLTPGDREAKGRLLLALLGHLVPEVWVRAAAEAIAAASHIGPFPSLEQLGGRMLAGHLSAAQRAEVQKTLASARAALDAAKAHAGARRYAEATDAAVQARRDAIHIYLATARERPRELRGVWIPSPSGVRGWTWDHTVRQLRDGHLNALFVNALRAGVAHYRSQVLPSTAGEAGQGDPLAECLRACKQAGIELHAWTTCYRLDDAPEAFVAALRADGRLARRRDGADLRCLCPSDPRNLALTRDATLELLRAHNVAGIHLDHICYPDADSCFCDGCRERFQQAAGEKVAKWPDDALAGPLKDRFAAWRQEQVTALVRTLAAEVRRARPGTLLSAAVVGDWETARRDLGQDWKRWLEEGLLDFVCPMTFTPDGGRFEEAVARQAEWVGGRVPLYVGIGAYRIPDTADLLDQIERARRLGADGFVLYHADDPELVATRLPDLARSLAAHVTAPPHPAPPAKFVFPPGLPNLPRLAYAEDTQVTVLALVEAKGSFARRVRGASGRLRLETVEGEAVRDLGHVRSSDRKSAKAVLRLPPGRYRLAIEGSVSLGWFRSRPFLVRSRPFDVLSRGAVEQARLEKGQGAAKDSGL